MALEGVADAARRAHPGAQLAADDEADDAVVLPTGAPTALACDDARTIVAQARATLAAPPGTLAPASFADALNDWLDPHGLWSVAPDAPASALVRHSAESLLAELEARPGSGPCVAAEAVGVELAAWSSELRAVFDEGYRATAHGRTLAGAESADGALEGAGGSAQEHPGARRIPASVWRLVASSPYEDGPVTRSARDLARTLGRDVGAIHAAYGDSLSPFAIAARERSAPSLDASGWARAVTAAALRAYVPQLDAHGAWAPRDEELSIYDLDLEADPPARLWSEMTRTALGVRIDGGALPPLANGDVVVRVQEVALAGISVEQAQQFAIVPDDAGVAVTVLREHVEGPISWTVTAGKRDPEAPAPAPLLSTEIVRYADGNAAIVTIPDVPDDLGARLGATLDHARLAGQLRGVVLDVRANGGGSTDGAIAALGYFLPGATLFPMRRRDGGIEVERAPDVSPEERWDGPLGVLVDGDSASAAEMIAGGLEAYHRAVVVGGGTYGKGCAQEYLDDDAHAGVLRLTTLLYALPDGSPVQKVGILPDLSLSLPPATEREAMTERALGPWRGPDVRDHRQLKQVAWMPHGGHVGPCADETVCRALRALGAAPAAAR